MTKEQPTSPADTAKEAAAEPGAAGTATGSPAEEIAKLQEQLQEAQDRAIRAQADLENFRKRLRKEIDEERRYADYGLLRDLLPVMDNILRAIEAAEKTPDLNALLEGFRLVGKQLETAFNQHHCQKIETLHKPFDPNVHTAVAQLPTAEHPPHTVIAELQAGYQMLERVLRPAQVMVSIAPPEND